MNFSAIPEISANLISENLENLIKNPTITDLIGGIQYVTLGDEEAKRRGSTKSILERKAPPTFQVAVEIYYLDPALGTVE